MSTILPFTLPNRRIILGVGTILLLVIGSIGLFQFQSREFALTEELEDATFIVTSFDIVGGTSQALKARGELLVNLTRRDIPQGLHIDSFEVDLFNQSEFITSLEVPLENILDTEVVEFEIEIPVENGNPSPTTATILVNIMTGIEFSLNFTSRIAYSVGGFPGKLEFSNTVLFDLDQRVLEINLENLAVPVISSQSSTQIEFSLFNPFSSEISMSGEIDILVQEQEVGFIDLDEILFIPGVNQVLEDVVLKTHLSQLYSLYFSSILDPIRLRTRLTLGFGQLNVGVSPTLDLQTTGLDFAFNITELDSLSFNTENGGISGLLGGDIISYLPLAFNLTHISGEILSGQDIAGRFAWDGGNSTSVLLSANSVASLSGVQFNSSLDKIPLFVNLATDLGFRNISIVIYVFDELIAYDINL